MTTATATYNGWKNRQTWNVALWIQNNEGLYRAAIAHKGDYRSLAGDFKAAGIRETPDGVNYLDEAIDTFSLDAMLRDLRND